ncbi:WD40 repeat-like protein [Pluteus cervinus]|uniref:WD40 repeat-like protein n=1 Tax=Pluteus cervinus TaxID=181527 RepID=A0ACD3B867_9AGAR|nr:WD40 repeat-like protein [Pluteus cervinus]
MIADVSAIPATKRKVRLEFTEPCDPALSAEPLTIYKSSFQHVEMGKDAVWEIDKDLPLVGAEVTISVMEKHHIHSKKVIAQYNFSRDSMFQKFLEDSEASELEFSSPSNTVKIKVKKGDLQEILDQLVLPESVLDRLGKSQKAVELLFGLGALSELHPIAKVVFGLFGIVKEKLDQQKTCYKEISDLLDKMSRFLPYFEKTGEVDNWKVVQDVIQKILIHMQNALRIVISYAEPSKAVQFAKFALSSKQKEEFSQLSTDYDDLLQEYTLAFMTELAILANNSVLQHLEQLKPVEALPGNICMKETRVFILNELSDWAQSGTDHIFWLYGLAGTGKSTIAASFVQWLQSARMLGAFFTCRKGHQALSSPLQLLQTICYRLSHVHKPYGKLVAQAIKDDPYFGSGTATITSFFQQFLEALLKESSDFGFSDQEIAGLVKVAAGLFIWADVSCNYLDNSLNKKQGLDILLKVTSSGDNPYLSLYQLYDTILFDAIPDSIENNEIFQRILGAMLLAVKPLTLGMLVQIAEQPNISESVVKQVIKRLHAVLLHSPDDKITVIHLSFSEYLLDGHCPERFTINNSLHQTQYNLFHYCYSTLLTELKFNICGFGSSYLPNNQVQDLEKRIETSISPALQYASLYWMHHYIECDGWNRAPSDQIVFEMFYSPRALYWMEVVGLLDQVFYVLKQLSKVKYRTENLKTYDLINDLSQIIDKYKVPILKATPHIYISLQPSLPEESILLQAINENKANLLQLKHGKLKSWTFDAIVLKGHTAEVLSVAYSQDGRYLVSGSRDKTMRIWDMTSGQPVIDPLQGHSDSVWSVSYSPNGTYMVSGSKDNTIRIWNAASGESIMELQKHTGPVWSVVYSPDNQCIASGSDDKTIIIWDATNGKPVMDLEGHNDSVWSVAYSPDGKYIVSGSDDIRIWDTTSKGSLVLRPLRAHNGSVWSVAYSPDGKYIVSGSQDKTIIIWNAKTGQPIMDPLEEHNNSVWSVLYSPNGNHIISGSDDKKIITWDAHSGEIIGNPSQESESILSVAYSPDDMHIAAALYDKTIRIHDATNGHPAKDLHHGHSAAVWSVVYSPDGKFIASGSHDSTVMIWNASNGQLVIGPLLGHKATVWSVAYSLNGQFLVSGSDDRTIIIWNANTGQVMMGPLTGHTAAVWSVACSPCSKYIVSGSRDDTLRVWSTVSGTLVMLPLQGHNAPVHSVAYSPNGLYIVSGSQGEAKIIIWNAIDGQQINNFLQGHNLSVNSVNYSPDSQYLVSGSDDGTIIIWNAISGKPAMDPLEGHSASISSVIYSSDGRHIASGSQDKTIRIWDTSSGQSIMELLEHDTPVSSLAYSPNNQYIVSGSHGSTIIIMDLHTGKTVPDELLDGIVYFPTTKHIVPHLSFHSSVPHSDAQPLNIQDADFLSLALLYGQISAEGWLTYKDKLLLWIPPYLRNVFVGYQKVVISQSPLHQHVVVDWTSFVHGEDWIKVHSS